MTFQEILREHGVPFVEEGDHHCRPGWLQIVCPYCGRGSGKYHLGYNLAKGYCSCWKCGSHRSWETLAELTGLPIGQVAKLLGSVDAVRTKTNEYRRRGKLVVPPFVGELQPIHERYLEVIRGFDAAELVRLWHIKAIGISTRLSWRIFIPWEHHGEVVSWNTRAISDHVELRYHGASEDEEVLSRKTLLYGEDLVRHGMVAVEGELDAWAIGPGCVATGGTALTRAQIFRMSRFPVRAVCFDNEPAAQKRARALVDELSAFPGETFNIQLDAKDAASAFERERHLVRKTAGLI